MTDRSARRSASLLAFLAASTPGQYSRRWLFLSSPGRGTGLLDLLPVRAPLCSQVRDVQVCKLRFRDYLPAWGLHGSTGCLVLMHATNQADSST